eukprot:CAMPEP_0205906562 /NCGR_PEP_ID=MMETSP1325-20131115/2016_1 /ASSEMBLY_ACC=CAM_ASM_000708 /TAXON_ID=236786 /ORGANISM="Florenciella sp., Strain RCC1007" /LENGTH=172 /DNA_ID=CAMNT_0053272585 /DNA_START=519 /DNA_END=1037 /DNA_ORIENTATION=+
MLSSLNSCLVGVGKSLASMPRGSIGSHGRSTSGSRFSQLSRDALEERRGLELPLPLLLLSAVIGVSTCFLSAGVWNMSTLASLSPRSGFAGSYARSDLAAAANGSKTFFADEVGGSSDMSIFLLGVSIECMERIGPGFASRVGRFFTTDGRRPPSLPAFASALPPAPGPSPL